MNLKESYQRTEDYAGHNPDTPLFARSLYDEYQRCSGDRYTIKTSRSNVLKPKITVKWDGQYSTKQRPVSEKPR